MCGGMPDPENSNKLSNFLNATKVQQTFSINSLRRFNGQAIDAKKTTPPAQYDACSYII